ATATTPATCTRRPGRSTATRRSSPNRSRGPTSQSWSRSAARGGRPPARAARDKGGPAMRLTLVFPSVGRKENTPYVKAWQMEALSMALLASLTPPEVELRFYDDRL